ncbi:Inner membrane protein YohK [Saezia sanguinis]|uniref:Inner membrane protein YohK n=1 Tax=Saezia sanguinis TaxID=1965230 RepID=A0A433S9V0_9BURK|nr:LrgB family protein [Saezia sanguinis]RUS65501.1 Inner membrane protein YohK [Saezia sanguinis]
MTDNFQDFWVYLSSTPLMGLTLTLIAYLMAYSFYTWRRYAPWATPLVWATLLIIAVLLLSNTSYTTYFEGAQFIHFLLGPSVVAMGLLLWLRWADLKKQMWPLLGASLIGGAVAVISVVLLAWAFGLPPKIILSLAPKSMTTSVAMGVAEKIGGEISLVAVFTIITGVMGALMGPLLFKLARIKSDAARGFALGTASHGIGTASAFQISPTAAAYAALAVGVQSVLGAVLIPLIYHGFF